MGAQWKGGAKGGGKAKGRAKKKAGGLDHGYRQQFFQYVDTTDMVPGWKAEPIEAAGEPGPPCLHCGAATVIKAAIEPMSRGFRDRARIECTKCRAWRWDTRPRKLKDGEVPF